MGREVVCEKDTLSSASGSVNWRQGGTEVLAAVHGPLPAQQRHAEADRAVVLVTIRPRSGLPGALLQELIKFLNSFEEAGASGNECSVISVLCAEVQSGPCLSAGGQERLHEAHVRHTVEACAVLSTFPQSAVLIALQVCLFPTGAACPACWSTSNCGGCSRRSGLSCMSRS